jgi:hypothetical protein
MPDGFERSYDSAGYPLYTNTKTGMVTYADPRHDDRENPPPPPLYGYCEEASDRAPQDSDDTKTIKLREENLSLRAENEALHLRLNDHSDSSLTGIDLGMPQNHTADEGGQSGIGGPLVPLHATDI